MDSERIMILDIINWKYLSQHTNQLQPWPTGVPGSSLTTMGSRTLVGESPPWAMGSKGRHMLHGHGNNQPQEGFLARHQACLGIQSPPPPTPPLIMELIVPTLALHRIVELWCPEGISSLHLTSQPTKGISDLLVPQQQPEGQQEQKQWLKAAHPNTPGVGSFNLHYSTRRLLVSMADSVADQRLPPPPSPPTTKSDTDASKLLHSTPHTRSDNVSTQRGVQQPDTSSPYVFSWLDSSKELCNR